MVEADAPPAVETPADEAPAVIDADNSEVPLKAPKRLPKPTREELNAKTDALAAEIKTRKARIEEINAVISRKRNGGQSPEEDAARRELNETRKQFRATLAQKQAFRGTLDELTAKRKQLRDATREMKTKNSMIGSGSKIEEQIKELQNRHSHSSMSLNEEKKLLAEIERLKASRTSSAAYDERLKALDDLEKEFSSAKDELKKCDDILNGIQRRQDTLNAELQKLREKAAENTADVPTLQAERDNCRTIVTEVYAKIKELREEHNDAHNKWWDNEQAFRAWRDKDKARKNEAYLKEKFERDEARKAEMAELAGDFFHKEVGLCDQLTAYLSKFVAADVVAPTTTAAAEAATIAGYKVYKKKDEDADQLFGLSAAKKGGKKGKKGSDRKAEQPAEQKLVHSMDNLVAFTTLNVEMPLTSSKVPATLEVIKARREYYLKKRAQMKESGAVPGQEAEGKENSATANGHTEPSTSKGAPVANGNANIDLSSGDTVQVSTTVKENGDVGISFKIEAEAFPSLH